MKKYPSKEKLIELFNYRDGHLIWKYRTNVSRHVNDRDEGKVAGSFSVDKWGFARQNIMINGKQYKKRNLIWIYHHGYIKEGFVKSKNRDDFDDRIENLFLSKNAYSQKSGSYKNKSSTGFKGVIKTPSGKFRAEIQVDKKRRYLGYCFTKEDAAIIFDDEYERVYGIRPNETISEPVKTISSAMGKNLQRMKKAKAEGRYLGVRVPKGSSKPYAYLKSKLIGVFDTNEQAARAYNIAAHEYYGDQAVLNDIPDPLGKGDIF